MTTSSKTEVEQEIKAERDRFRTVMSSEAYKGREASANHLLFNTDLDAAAITGTLVGTTADPSQFEVGRQIASNLPAEMRRR